jgi:response regulator RpfG family c-di-GMP phosphodiesterase
MMSSGMSLPALADDFIVDDETDAVEAADHRRWKVLVVDDEPDVHAITRVVLGDFRYDDRAIEIFSAYSRGEAERLLSLHADVALVLLDVVMEETDSGLRLVRFVREELANALVRLVLRTGQPGYAPEREVIVRYDINDYKEKTELTAQKLFTTVVGSLRAYEYLAQMERQRAGLEEIVRANRVLAGKRERTAFTTGALGFLVALARARGGMILCEDNAEFELLAQLSEVPEISAVRALARAGRGPGVILGPDFVLVPVPSRTGATVTACLTGAMLETEEDRALLGVLAEAVGAGLDNVLLLGRLQDAQRAMVIALARMAEFRDADTGRHVHRVEQLVRAVAVNLREVPDFSALSDDDYLEQLALASILHDVGKVGVPDAVLNKPGSLDNLERQMMHDHVAIGAEILEEAARMVPGMSYISLAAEIAANHHENADGSGYPKQKTLAQIPLSARIVGVADVYDALVSERPYKRAWPPEVAIAWLREMAGQRFDPRVVEALALVVSERSSVPVLDATELAG